MVGSTRPLTAVERDLVRWFAERVSNSQRRQLLSDLENASAIEDVGSITEFHIDGYSRPTGGLERPVPVDAVVQDADGATILVVLTEDENGRLYELELNRCSTGDVIAPNWRTLRALQPHEVHDVGTTEVRVWRTRGFFRTRKKI
jgi:hypothetical protein